MSARTEVRVRKAKDSVVYEILLIPRPSLKVGGIVPILWVRTLMFGVNQQGMQSEASSPCPVPFQAIMQEGGFGSLIFSVGASEMVANKHDMKRGPTQEFCGK